MIARARLTVGSLDMGVEVEVHQSVNLRVDDQHNVATVATVAAIGPAEWLELFTQHRVTAVTTVAGLQMQYDTIYKTRHKITHTSERRAII